MKTAIVVLSDPQDGGEEALGRLFNALAVAYDLIGDNALPGTSGLPSLARYLADGYRVLTF